MLWTILSYVALYLFIGISVATLVFTIWERLDPKFDDNDGELRVMLTLMWPLLGGIGTIFGIGWCIYQVLQQVYRFERRGVEWALDKLAKPTCCKS